MDWMGLLSIAVASWCGVDIGIAIKEKNRNSIIFNSIVMFIEWMYILFRQGV